MANKKSSKPKTADKTVFRNELILGILLIASVVLNLVTLNRGITYEESQELQAFKGVVERMIGNEYGGEDGKSAFVTGYGVTDDKDLYADFIMTEYEDHVPIRYKKARLHFQCNQKTDRISGCSHALWAEKEWTETSEEYRAEYRSYNDAVEALVDRYNSTEDESEREKIIEEEKELDKKFDKSFFEYWK